jgi:VanZ family protein
MTRLKILLLILYVVTIFFLSSRPDLTSPGPTFHLKDKVVHLAEYFCLGLLLFGGMGFAVSRTRPGLVFLFLLTVGISIGAMDEMLQSYIPGRQMDLYDWIADFIGVALGVGLSVTIGFRNRFASNGGVQ